MIPFLNKGKPVDSSPHESSEDESCGIPVGQKLDKEMHIGQGIFLPVRMYDHIVRNARSGQQFVRSMSVEVFGFEALAKCSVTGKQSQRTGRIKPQLDPTKLQAIRDVYKYYLTKKKMPYDDVQFELEKIKVYIARKIADICKQQRKVESEEVSKNS